MSNLKDEMFFIVGNGPSLQTSLLDNLPDGRWIGMNAAYKYWEKTGKYPIYYACLDPVVAVSHASAIKRLADEYLVSELFLHEEILKKVPEFKNDPRITLRDSFVKNAKILPFSPLSLYKQTTGVLATRFCIEKGHNRLCLLGIDCNYVERLSEARSGEGYELVIKDTVRRNPNYFFDNYQEKNEKYQVPNPEVHSGNLHLQSFIALRNDIVNSDAPVRISVGSRKSLLSKFGVFPYLDVAASLGKRRLAAVAVPLMPHELDGFLERIDYWIDPKLQPSFGKVEGVALHIFMSCEERPELREKIEAMARRLPWLSHYFTTLRITFLDLPPAIDYYVKGTSLNVFCNKSGPNIFWLMIMAACQDYQHTFLMETDCVPVRPGWLDALEQATRDCPVNTWVFGANYFGPTMTAPINGFHINGNAIYATGDHCFQDYMKGDFLRALQWMAEQVSNSVAYDVAFALGMHNYQEAIRKIGVDLRQYVWRYSFTPVIRNISGQTESENSNLVDIMREVRTDVSMFVCHGHPALRWLVNEFNALDSFYHDDAQVVRELRVHKIGSLTKFVTWKSKGYGIVEAALHLSQEAWPGQMRVIIGAISEHCRGGYLQLSLATSKKLVLSKVDAIGHVPGKGKITLEAELVPSESGIVVRLRADACTGKVKEFEIELTFAVPPTVREDRLEITALRLLHYPSVDKGLNLEICAKDDEVTSVERAWTDWIRRGQAALNYRYSFIKCTQPKAMPALKEIVSTPKAGFEGGLMLLPLAGNATARLRFGVKPKSGAEPDIHLSVRITAGADCDLTLGGKAFGYSIVEEKRRLAAGKSTTIGLRFRLNPSKGSDFFISFDARPVIASAVASAPVLEIEKISVLQTPQFTQETIMVEGPVRIISINPDAESFFGHFLNYEARLGKALVAAGLEHVIAGPVDAEAEVYKAHPEMVQVFTGRTNTLYAKQSGAGVPGLATFEAELNTYLATLKHDEATLLFMYCGSFEMAEVFARLADRYPSCTFATSLYYLSWLDLTSPVTRDYWRPRLAKVAAHPRIRLIVPSPELAEDLQTNYGVNPEILPHPTTTFHDDEVHALKAGSDDRPSKSVTVVFPGNHRGGKGYELTRDAILALLDAKIDRLKLRVRCPPDDSLNKVRRVFFDSIRNRVEIMDSYLDETAFRNLLLSADLVVLPYTADRFGNRTSGLLVDSLLLGIPCVVIEKTWLAGTVSHYGFGLVSPENGTVLAAKVREALGKISELKAAALAGRDRYMQANSWAKLVEFLCAPSRPDSGLGQPVVGAFVSTPSSDTITTEDTRLKKRLLLIGNGPSTRILAEAGFHKIPADMDTFGTTAAFRYFEQIGWWPTYYALADRKVVFHHRSTFARLLKDPNVTTKIFYLSWKVSESERLEVIPHSSTGSFCLKKAIEMGYREIYLIGMEGTYIEEIMESRPLSDAEIENMGFNVLNLTPAERKLRIIEVTPSYNPNYFYPGYQIRGDVYSLPQAHTHQSNWIALAETVREAGAKVFNLSPLSKIDAFPRAAIHNIFDFIKASCWENIPNPFSDSSQSLQSRFEFEPDTGFIFKQKNTWHCNLNSDLDNQLKMVFQNVGVIEGRTLVGGFKIMSNSVVAINVNLGRHGEDDYEGTNQILHLEPGKPLIVDLSWQFEKQHRAVKLQITIDDTNKNKHVDLTIEGVYLTESVTSVVSRYKPDLLTLEVANRYFREREYSIALAIYLYLLDMRELGIYRRNAAFTAGKIGLLGLEDIDILATRLR
jgi:hypothetical protein